MTYFAVRKASQAVTAIRQWALPEAVLCFLIPGLGVCIPMLNSAWTGAFFRERNIPLGFAAPLDEELVAWAEMQDRMYEARVAVP